MNIEAIISWVSNNEAYFPFNATWSYVKSILLAGVQELSSTDITSSAQKLISNPHLLVDHYKTHDPLIFASYFTAAITVVHYLASEITRDYSQVDRCWSILPGIYAWHFTIHNYISEGTLNLRLVVASILISIWGARLTYNFARKGGYYRGGQDYRYAYLIEKIGTVPMAVLNITFIAPFQNVLLLLLALPLYVASKVSNKTACLSKFDWSIVAAHLGFLLIEAVSDEQQYVFQTAKHALLKYMRPEQLKGDFKDGFLWHSGLFQYSRHPNFFAEISMWWVVYMFSVSAVQEATGTMGLHTFLNWTAIGPFILTLLFYSSTALTEVTFWYFKLTYLTLLLFLIENLFRKILKLFYI
ncbi:hypothetical protein BY458DRAFT_524675 [Sporodiniella umbellata]|nr:hypothetical protein BY458DRAFT_524675 [Sporodiniella umbellata]